MASKSFGVVIFSALVLGALTECVMSTGSCAGVDPETDAATLLQAETIAERHFANSQKSKLNKKLFSHLKKLIVDGQKTLKAAESTEGGEALSALQFPRALGFYKKMLLEDMAILTLDLSALENWEDEETLWHPAA